MLIPIFTNPKFLTPADNGLLNLYSQSVIFIVPFISLSIIQSATVDYFTFKQQDFRDLCVSGFTMACSTTVIALLTLFLLRGQLAATFGFPDLFFWAIPLLALFSFVYDFVLSIVRNQEDAMKFLKISLSKITIELGLALILVVAFSWHWAGRIAGMIVATGIVGAYGFYFLSRQHFLKGKIRLSIVKREVKYSIPIILLQVSSFCLLSAGTFLLSALTGNNSLVGVFGLSAIFGSVVFTFSTSLLQFFIPRVNKELAKPAPDYRLIFGYFKNYTIATSLWFLFLLIIVPLIYNLFINSLYHPGISFYFYISLGFQLWAVASFLYLFLLFHKQKRILSFLGAVSIIISISLNYLFILKYEALGAAIALLFSYVLVLALIIYFTRSHLKKMLRAKRVLKA